MHNDLFSIGPVTVHGYGLMIAIGILAAYFTADHRAKKRNLDREVVLDLVFYCTIFGFLASKTLYILTQLKNIIEDPSRLLSFTSGWVVLGGIIGGIFGGWLCCKIKKQDFWRFFDLVLPSVALAQAIGRIGCLLAGCCYGAETTCAFHIVFTDSAFAPNNVWLIPTQIISSGLDFLLFFALLVIDAKWRGDKHGTTGAFYLIFYSIGRFILEFYRGDLVRGTIGILSTSQFISIFTLVAGILLLVLARKGKLSKQSA